MNEPLACNMNVFSPAERQRHGVLVAKLIGAPRAIANGYEVDVDPANLAELAEWIELERRCCPFLDFAMTLRLTTAPASPPPAPQVHPAADRSA